MNKRYIPLLIAMLILGVTFGKAYGQKKENLVTIESIVKDESGNPIPDALISGKEGAIEARSGSDGKFSISVPENSDLLIEAQGFEMKTLPAAQALQGISLVKAPFLMDEASTINIPFTKIKAKETVGAIDVLNPKDLVKYDNSQYLYDAMSSRLTGMLGNTNIRGVGTAVFVVDGVPRDASNINIEEVDQITVLKDGNAAMMYGTHAKNGVILITTKRGQAFKRKINTTFEQGIS
jgi:TonB-dependent SusC/RagA subfamily outer membrane receptor